MSRMLKLYFTIYTNTKYGWSGLELLGIISGAAIFSCFNVYAVNLFAIFYEMFTELKL